MFLIVCNSLLFILVKPAKGREKRAVREIFRRLCAAVKQPFLCCDPDSVQPLTPQPDTAEVRSVPGPSRIRPTADADHAVPELVCLPGQVFEDLPLVLTCVPGSTGIKSPVLDSSCLDLPNGEALLLWFMLFLPCSFLLIITFCCNSDLT